MSTKKMLLILTLSLLFFCLGWAVLFAYNGECMRKQSIEEGNSIWKSTQVYKQDNGFLDLLFIEVQ